MCERASESASLPFGLISCSLPSVIIFTLAPALHYLRARALFFPSLSLYTVLSFAFFPPLHRFFPITRNAWREKEGIRGTLGRRKKAQSETQTSRECARARLTFRPCACAAYDSLGSRSVRVVPSFDSHVSYACCSYTREESQSFARSFSRDVIYLA